MFLDFNLARSYQTLSILIIALSLFVLAGCSTSQPIMAITPIPVDSVNLPTPGSNPIPTLEPAPSPMTMGDLGAESAYPGLSEEDARLVEAGVDIFATAVPYPGPEDWSAAEPTVAIIALPTFTPWPELEDLPAGEARERMFENDVATVMGPEAPVELEDEPISLAFNEFFVDYQPYSDVAPTMSDKLLALDGKMVEVEGYMSPPLKLGLDWFMLTSLPLSFCPFHSSAATITPDIALVYFDGAENIFTWEPLRIRGELHVGEATDPESGMVSLVRIYTEEDGFEIIKWGE